MDENTKALIAAQLAAGMLASGHFTFTKQNSRDADFAVGVYLSVLASMNRNERAASA
ncbi:hypothetical protein SAMN02800692_1556 [Luteibacter sp. UNC138MFCol5.1]|uniref:hypothetical protein n=1 Tax=Luteibacter sp. UNC138MFCol5.1 TaxID=1502774 RepID=UPI0008CE358D|nr:hypothetical protein [Luteibacter sp. UNC138MFCol5.1]SEO64155.1 hypothetical protein SAMN02800692_1556 [Luteibacter sp. UNC138MFCol5.1]